jgi:hypothetical protein
MAAEPPPRYWEPPDPVVGYSRFDAVLADPRTLDLLENSPVLDEFVDRATRVGLVNRGRRRALDLLMTLHFAGSAADHPGMRSSR